MRILNINPINFMAKRTQVQHSEPQSASEKFTKKSFYSQIEGYLQKQYNEEKYLKMFSDGVDKIVQQNSISEYTPIERKYISNLISIMDMSENLKKIPDNYLKTNMEHLLKFKK